ncbi:DNA-binding HTH domain-containing protein [Hoeflea phototrophica DFL-43]|uniref:DNA-binding HTH domain-containing protein n=1 Tax=Hoeflea phototrophica (strain DSM 17068 / NCIMB 14078 / DFL-43) TaxID=411684 RepID=A9D0L4_HOEPD|nr:helix-turn-helix transcriptional regulator [Hoeflea phototrophica]EDQ35019.2 DNA-binding HTH domain-containing protein [Hoeflea phototrophica DFL-43]
MTECDYNQDRFEPMRQRLNNCTTQFDLLRLLREVTQFHQYTYFFIASGCDGATRSLADSIIITSAPSDLVRRYDETGLMERSPLMRALGGRGTPLQCRLDETITAFTTEQQAALDDFSAEFNIDCCFITPVYHRDHGPAAVCFLGKRNQMSFSEAANLAMISSLAHQKLRRVSAQPSKADSPLTERERECLVWTSSGKTSVEIARILSLSEHTVNHYLNNAARKLDAVNRTQAVALAIRQGFIE